VSKPLVSIVIPTYNSERTLPLCLKAISCQTYKEIEVIIVDSYSIDRTRDIAKSFGASVILTNGKLLWARYLGHINSKGEIELLLDSDQVLELTTIERGVEMIINGGYDALILEEKSYKPRSLLQWLFHADRLHVHKIKDLHPLYGVLLARMYKRSILDKAFEDIKRKLPKGIFMQVVSQDHAIIYYESWKYISKIGLLNDAMYHVEIENLSQLIKKFYNYGRYERILFASDYNKLLLCKHIPRKPFNPLNPVSYASLILWFLKAVPYLIGTLV